MKSKVVLFVALGMSCSQFASAVQVKMSQLDVRAIHCEYNANKKVTPPVASASNSQGKSTARSAR